MESEEWRDNRYVVLLDKEEDKRGGVKMMDIEQKPSNRNNKGEVVFLQYKRECAAGGLEGEAETVREEYMVSLERWMLKGPLSRGDVPTVAAGKGVVHHTNCGSEVTALSTLGYTSSYSPETRD